MMAMPLILLILTAVSAALATNYCDPKLCGRTKHIACGNYGAFAARCIDPEVVSFTKRQRDLIVRAHNKVRNRVAGGTSALQPACRMATMQWDDELAALAVFNVKQCKGSHDCHNTATFKYSGQNLAWMTYNDSPNTTEMSLKSVDMWYDESKNTKMEYINKYPSNYRGPTIGHFTVMVADRNIRVGCAASTYMDPDESQYAFLFACNYASTNLVGTPTYKSCTSAASLCETGRNRRYRNLCSPSEKYEAWH
ncbi:antigen 5 like allergen Cul n 1-like [Bactrocera neohumeralis]|uniref:antigen 5 like allergen Cul n 1-like n=1 Tax=Bactrocera tryoni TaxID=59916 RepID=UPI001A9A082C|nr:antigen 5 like allergen Cul n 1-like [Bactrocera tryoni]XP_050328256.1 antigen 5 like allergen Cul n 1-like [Bactrocera neohumeralis]